MRANIVPFEPEHLPALARFSERTWRRPSAPAYYRWRYLEFPLPQVAFLALRDGECMAFYGAVRRRYWVGGAEVEWLEGFDWHSLPELRGLGFGILVMKALMDQPQPLVAVGVTDEARALVLKMGWREVAAAHQFVRPLASSALRSRVAARLRVPEPLAGAVAEVAARTWFRTRARRGPAAAQLQLVAGIGEEVTAIYGDDTGYGVVQIPEPSHQRWLSAAWSGMGHFLPLYFLAGGTLRGWALVRVYERNSGREATLVDLFAPSPDVDLCAWMVSCIVELVAGIGAHTLWARATCPIVCTALRRNRFLHRLSMPVLYWSRDPALPPGPVHLLRNNGDEPLLPYPADDETPPPSLQASVLARWR